MAALNPEIDPETGELLDPETGKLLDWEQDPYDPIYRGSFMRNRADDQKFDGQFPDHPLTKVRLYVDEPVRELRVEAAIKKAEPFRYRDTRSGLWSRLWR